MAPALGPSEVGQILALRREGRTHPQTADRVTRGRVDAGPKIFAIGAAIRRLDADPMWTGKPQANTSPDLFEVLP